MSLKYWSFNLLVMILSTAWVLGFITIDVPVSLQNYADNIFNVMNELGDIVLNKKEL